MGSAESLVTSEFSVSIAGSAIPVSWLQGDSSEVGSVKAAMRICIKSNYHCSQRSHNVTRDVVGVTSSGL